MTNAARRPLAAGCGADLGTNTTGATWSRELSPHTRALRAGCVSVEPVG
jgi:hypothetical protein